MNAVGVQPFPIFNQCWNFPLPKSWQVCCFFCFQFPLKPLHKQTHNSNGLSPQICNAPLVCFNPENWMKRNRSSDVSPARPQTTQTHITCLVLSWTSVARPNRPSGSIVSQ